MNAIDKRPRDLRLSTWLSTWAIATSCAAITGCPNADTPPNDAGADADTSLDAGADDAGTTDAGTTDGGVIPDDAGVPEAKPGVVAENPTDPDDDAGGKLTWPTAPLLEGVLVAANRDSAKLVLPIVPGAQDYRVFAIPAGVSIATDPAGHETVLGSTLFCAGFRQHNAPAATPELLRQVEVAGLTAKTRLVVEALDTTCPFPGVHGRAHADIPVDNVEVAEPDRGPFSVYTEPEITQKYGSLIVNGHAPGPHVGAPAPVAPPKVLARTTLEVTPAGTAEQPMSFFDDFDSADQPVFISELPVFDRTQQAKLFRNLRWNFTTYGADLSQVFLDRGRLHTLLADWAQDIFASNVAYPRSPVELSATDYLHVSFEVASDATQRRYWWLHLCGAESAGATIDASGKLLGNIIQTPFFYQEDGLNPSVEGWNCLQIFPRDGYAFPLPPDDTNPESDVRVMVNLAGQPAHENVVNVSPPMYPAAVGKPSWYRQRDATGALVAPILDDQMLIAPSTHYDFYIRRDRVVMFVDGQQRLCNDFPAVALTMAEAALGFGQVLYHSAAERGEFSAPYWDRTGQRYYLQNTPFIDARAWDNLGYTEHVAAPPSLSTSSCYVHKP